MVPGHDHRLQKGLVSSPFGRFARPLIGSCLAVGFVARLLIALRPLDVLTHRYLADDYFYYLNVAFHVASGQGSTFDGGISRTNGYNPLLMWLLTAAFWLGANKVIAIRIGLLIEAICMAAAGALAATFCLRKGAPKGALLVAGLLSVNPFFAWPTLTGFETGLALFTMLLALELWDRGVAAEWVGVASGVAFLARADAIALAFALWVSWLRRKQWRAALRLGLGFLPVSVPFCVWSAHVFGLLLPGSALQKAHVRTLASIENSIRVFFRTLPGILVPHRVLDYVPALVIWVLAAGTFLLCLAGARRWDVTRSVLLAGIVVPYSVLADGYEAGALKRYWFLGWALLAMAAALGMDCPNGRLWRALRMEPYASTTVSLTVALIVLTHLFDCAFLLRWDRATKPVRSYVGACRDLASVLATLGSEGDRIGSFDAGSLGYFSHRPVVNLDGLVNDDIRMVKHRCRDEPYRGCLLRYLHEKKISIFVGGTAFGWTEIFPDWVTWKPLYAPQPLADGARVVVLQVPE